MPGPLISVIMPTYNRAGYLGESIRSVLDQTFSDFELIIVDDGSTDQTETMVRSFRDRRIRYRRQSHRGISAARNTAIRSACGLYVAHLDSDDIWLPNLLAVEVAAFCDPGIGVVYGRAQAMDPTGRLLPIIVGIPQRYPEDSFLSLLYTNVTAAIVVLVRRSCFEQVGFFDESMITAGDWDMWIRLSRRYRFFFVDEVLARFRLHSGRINSSTALSDILKNRRRVLDKAFADPGLPEVALAVKPLAYRNIYIFECVRWFEKRRFRLSFGSLTLAMRAGSNRIITLCRVFWYLMDLELLNRRSWRSRLRMELLRRLSDLATMIGFRRRSDMG
jgi:glycosyltransferase involved in cell wall biosynthesis